MNTNYFDTKEGVDQQDTTTSESSSSESETESNRTATNADEAETKKDAVQMLSALDAFAEVTGPPDFLDPEATRPSPAVLVERKRKELEVDERHELEKKPRPTVIAVKPVTYDKPRIPQPDPPPSKEMNDEGSKSMEVGDFLAKGGGAMLPRQNKIQREKEKAKREKGQSSHSVWKSEEEMLLRQQFDS